MPSGATTDGLRSSPDVTRRQQSKDRATGRYQCSSKRNTSFMNFSILQYQMICLVCLSMFTYVCTPRCTYS